MGAQRRTLADDRDRQWLERAVAGGGAFADAVDRFGFEAVLESLCIAEASGVVHRIDRRTTPWAGRPGLKKRLDEAQAAMAALRRALDEEVFGR